METTEDFQAAHTDGQAVEAKVIPLTIAAEGIRVYQEENDHSRSERQSLREDQHPLVEEIPPARMYYGTWRERTEYEEGRPVVYSWDPVEATCLCCLACFIFWLIIYSIIEHSQNDDSKT